MAEPAAKKALRLLTEGRLMIERIDPETRLVIARCRGDSGQVYDLGRDPNKGEWRCTCEARGDDCSHLRALKLVVSV